MYTNGFDKLVQCAIDCKSSGNVEVVLFLTLKMQEIQDSCLSIKLGCLYGKRLVIIDVASPRVYSNVTANVMPVVCDS